jgi:hypothetical protein
MSAEKDRADPQLDDALAKWAEWITVETTRAFSGKHSHDYHQLLKLAGVADTRAMRESLFEHLYFAQFPRLPAEAPRKAHERVANSARALIAALKAVRDCPGGHVLYWPHLGAYPADWPPDPTDAGGLVQGLAELVTRADEYARNGRKRGQPAKELTRALLERAIEWLEKNSPTYRAGGNLSRHHRAFVTLFHDLTTGKPDPEPLEWQLRQLLAERISQKASNTLGE